MHYTYAPCFFLAFLALSPRSSLVPFPFSGFCPAPFCDFVLVPRRQRYSGSLSRETSVETTLLAIVHRTRYHEERIISVPYLNCYFYLVSGVQRVYHPRDEFAEGTKPYQADHAKGDREDGPDHTQEVLQHPDAA